MDQAHLVLPSSTSSFTEENSFCPIYHLSWASQAESPILSQVIVHFHHLPLPPPALFGGRIPLERSYSQDVWSTSAPSTTCLNPHVEWGIRPWQLPAVFKLARLFLWHHEWKNPTRPKAESNQQPLAYNMPDSCWRLWPPPPPEGCHVTANPQPHNNRLLKTSLFYLTWRRSRTSNHDTRTKPHEFSSSPTGGDIWSF